MLPLPTGREASAEGYLGSPISRPVSIARSNIYRINGIARLSVPIVFTHLAPVMSQSLASGQNDPHQSPIWIKAEHVLCFSTLGTCVPHTIFGTKPCPIGITESVVQPSLSSPEIAHGLGETLKNDGRPGCPIRVVGYARPQPGSSRPPKSNPETLIEPHTAFDA